MGFRSSAENLIFKFDKVYPTTKTGVLWMEMTKFDYFPSQLMIALFYIIWINHYKNHLYLSLLHSIYMKILR